MKPFHRIQSLLLVLTLVAACSYSLAQTPKQHRDPCHRRNDRGCRRHGHAVELYLWRCGIDTMVNAVPGIEKSGKHQRRADFECRIPGHVLRHHAEACQAHQRIAAHLGTWMASWSRMAPTRWRKRRTSLT